MRSNWAIELERVLNRRLGITFQVESTSEDGFSDLRIRSGDPENAFPLGWQLNCETLGNAFFAEFNFDDSARALNDFYLQRLNEVKDNWHKEAAYLIEVGFDLEFLLNNRVANLEEIVFKPELQRFRIISKKVTSNFDLEYLSESLLSLISFVLLPLIPESIEDAAGTSESKGFPEGSLVQVKVNKYERNPRNRAICLEKYGFSCQACGMNFANVYGEFAADYIHVHHTTPVSMLGDNYVIDPLNDLVPLCPNCHAAAHLQEPPLSVEELKIRLKGV